MKTVTDKVTALVEQFGPEDVLAALSHTLKQAERDASRWSIRSDLPLYFRALWEGIEALQKKVLVAEPRMQKKVASSATK